MKSGRASGSFQKLLGRLRAGSVDSAGRKEWPQRVAAFRFRDSRYNEIAGCICVSECLPAKSLNAIAAYQNRTHFEFETHRNDNSKAHINTLVFRRRKAEKYDATSIKNESAI